MSAKNLDRFGKLFDLTGKVAIVTGGAQGNGLGIANALVDAGAKVVTVDLRYPEAPSEKPEENLYDCVDKRILDITKEEEVVACFAKIKEDYGSIDILVNNAGVSYGRMKVDEMDMQKFENTIRVNVFGTYNCTKAVAPYMKEARSGKIVNISSSSAFLKTQGATAYSTSKVSISHLTRVWGNELAPFNINVNALAPSFVLTPMSLKTIQLRADAAGKTFDEMKEETLSGMPLHRFISVEEVANWVVLLCSEFAVNTTGTNFSLSAGVAQL